MRWLRQKQAAVSPETEWERTVLRGLAEQWAVEGWALPAPLRARLRRPLFRLADFEARWGQWDRERREIALSRKLLREHPWSWVRDVLRHELAHQVADEAWGGDETPHGALFRRACELLAGDADAPAPYEPFQRRFARVPADPRERILARVRKLFALAGSANLHEAEAALAKAHEQMARHNLRAVESGSPRACFTLSLGCPALRRASFDYALALLLQDFYFVQSVWVPAFVLARGRMGSALEISGAMENLKLAEYVYEYIRRYGAEQWARQTPAAQKSVRRRDDFLVGVIRGFREKLQGSGERAAPGRALVRRGDPALETYLRRRYPRLRRVGGRGRRTDWSVVRRGEQAGRRLVIVRGVEDGASSGRGLLNPN